MRSMPSANLSGLLPSCAKPKALPRSWTITSDLAEIANHLSNYFVWMGAPERAVASSQRALTHATACGDVTSQVVIRFNLGWAYATMGEYGQAIDLTRSIAALLQEDMRSGRREVAASCRCSVGTCWPGR